jgi:predicted RNase H-like HicB family nuclease
MGIEIESFFHINLLGGFSMKNAYPVLIKESGSDFLVYVPDMEIYTEGKSITEAIEMARDAIGLKGISIEDDEKEMPIASSYEKAREKAANDADEIFDYSDGMITFVDVDFTVYRRKVDKRAVKKNCTIPNWLNIEAEKAGINFSKVLQEALMEKVNANS